MYFFLKRIFRLFIFVEEFGVVVGEEVDDGGRVGFGVVDVFVVGFKGDERLEFFDVDGRSLFVVVEKVEVYLNS